MTNEPSPYLIRRNGAPSDDVITLESYQSVDEPLFSLAEAWRILRHHQWLILGVVVVALLGALIYTLTRTPLYSAEATLMIERQAPRVLKAQEDTQPAAIDYYSAQDYYKTQYEVLRSRDLAASALRDSGIENELAAAARKITADNQQVASGAAPTVTPDRGATSDAQRGLIGQYQSMLTVTPVPGTSLVRVGFTTPDAKLSAQLANIHTAAYSRYGTELRSKANQDALDFLQKKLLDLKERVEKSEAALNGYRKQKGIISIDDKENLVTDRLSDLNNRLTEAEAERIGLEAQAQLVRHGGYDALPSVAASALVQGLKGELSRLQGEYSQLAKEFKPGYPRLDKVKAQIDSVEKQLAAEVGSEARRVESALSTARAKEKELRGRLEEQKRATLDLKDSAVQYAVLAREVDTNRQLYDSVLQRLKEMGVAAEVRLSNVYVMEKAEVPAGPSYPRRQHTLLLGLVLGLAGGIGLAFLLDRLDNTIKTPAESELYLHLPNLAVIPDFLKLNNQAGGYLPHHMRKLIGREVSHDSQGQGKELILDHHPLSIIAESYRSLRTSLLLSRAAERPRSLLFTSATRHEGKTATAVNTAIMFAQSGLRTVLIDADLRRPRCHRVLSMEKELGLTELLTGHAQADQVIRATATENFFFLSSGTLPPNPAELLGSKKMLEVIQELAAKYDCVIFDSPPVLPVTDAVLIARNVDGVVLIVDSQNTAKHLIREVRSKLVNFHAKILGVVLNRVDTQRAGYAQYYSHYTNYYNEEAPRHMA